MLELLDALVVFRLLEGVGDAEVEWALLLGGSVQFRDSVMDGRGTWLGDSPQIGSSPASSCSDLKLPCRNGNT